VCGVRRLLVYEDIQGVAASVAAPPPAVPPPHPPAAEFIAGCSPVKCADLLLLQQWRQPSSPLRFIKSLNILRKNLII
tara:strand:+ start:542 stop:775 length:234 start_codon:yes stop_codon:yes gene_type:complete